MDFENDFEDNNNNNQENQVPDYQNNQDNNNNFGGGYNANENQNQNQNQNQAAQPEKQQKEKKELGACGFLQIEFYQPFFDVSTEEVITRLKTALLPTKPVFFQISRDNPDLWGPFWIYTSLVLIISVVGNIQRFFSADDKDKFHFQYSYVPLGAMLVYTIGFGTPILLTIIMKCFGNIISVFQMVCLYGYSMASYLPILVLCMIPFDWIQWIFVLVATVISIAFMIINLQAEFSTYEAKRRYAMFAIIIGVQILFLLFIKLHFLESISESKSDSGKEIPEKKEAVKEPSDKEGEGGRFLRF